MFCLEIRYSFRVRLEVIHKKPRRRLAGLFMGRYGVAREKEGLDYQFFLL
jgi:hypothetical protein